MPRPTSPPVISSSTSSTRRVDWSPSTVPRPRTRPASSSGLMRNRTERYPEGMLRVSLFGDPTRALGSLAEPECRRIIAALDLAEELGRTGGVVRALGRGEDRDGQRHREHGLDRRGAAADRRVHAGRGRAERGDHRHQRRRAALLERRGDHAHAHPGHTGHDPRQRHGAHRQAGARLLGGRLRRGQLRHRRLRADHGPERRGPVLGAGPRRRLPAAAVALRAHLCGARRALPPPSPHRRPGRSRRPRRAPLLARVRSSARRRHLLRRHQPRAQEAVRHPLGDARRDRLRPPASGALGRRCATPRRRSPGRRTSAAGP